MPSVRADPAHIRQTFHQPSETVSECEALSARLLSRQQELTDTLVQLLVELRKMNKLTITISACGISHEKS